ncbi:unnamed protein product [Sphagnum jensenii]|uniref:Uncharacterized protein n=1 Tax=Sphagnum jensenii TaxID=128206 RepID=A0ABP1BB67_9BRYO
MSEVIESGKVQLQATTWTDDQINAIENDHCELLMAYRRENDISSIVDQHDHNGVPQGERHLVDRRPARSQDVVQEAWDSLDGARFD